MMDDDNAMPGEWQDCYACGGDGEGDDCMCGDDTCCCASPEPVTCRTCHGEGGWIVPLHEP